MKEILKMERVSEITGLARSTIYRLEQQQKFPQRLKLTPRSSGWLKGEVEAWIDARANERESNNDA